MTGAPERPPSSPPPSPAEPRLRLGAVALAWLVGFFASNTAVLVFLAVTGRLSDPDPLGDVGLAWSAVFQAFLWVGLVGGPVLFSRLGGSGSLRRDFSLWGNTRDVLHLLTGVGTQLVLVPLLYVPIWLVFGDRDLSEDARELTERATTAPDVVLLVLLVGIGAPIAEELFFRGALMTALRQRGLGPSAALWVSSGLFGLAHLQVLQLPALVLVGLVCGVLRLRSGRLGPAVAAHVGFNLTALVTLLV